MTEKGTAEEDAIEWSKEEGYKEGYKDGYEKGKKETAKAMLIDIEKELVDLSQDGGYWNILPKKWREIKKRWCKE